MSAGTNGEVELRVPALGLVRIAGRDVLLAATLMVLGAGAIAVQVVTLRTTYDAIRADVHRAVELHGEAKLERAQMLALLRLRTCTAEYLASARVASPETARADVMRVWGELCLGAGK